MIGVTQSAVSARADLGRVRGLAEGVWELSGQNHSGLTL